MKKTVLFFALMLTLSNGYSQTEEKEITQADRDQIAQDLEHEANVGKHDNKTKRLLRKVADGFKKTTKDIVVEVKALDDCVNCQSVKKPKGEVILTNLGRKLGRGSAWLSTATSKPFMNVAGFLTGIFERKDKNQDLVALYKFILNHQADFDKLYLEAGTPEELVELILAKTEEIVEKKHHVILKDYLKSLGIKRELPADLSDFELTDAEIASIDMSKVTPDFINNHPEYKDVRGIIGDVKQEELSDIIISGYFDKSIGPDKLKAAMPKIHESAVTLVGQIVAPKVALGVISKSLAGLYLVPTVLADVGTGVSTALCLQEQTQARFEADKDLRSFCSYVTNRSAYQITKSRAKGYVAGKNSRAKIEQKIKERKERRAKRREEKQARKDLEASAKQLPLH